jgi:hypothetical protein
MDQNMGFSEFKQYYISDENRKIIQEEFEKYFDSDELQNAIMALLRLILVFQSKGHERVVTFLAETVTSAEETAKKRFGTDVST